jgi:hypothetical protein
MITQGEKMTFFRILIAYSSLPNGTIRSDHIAGSPSCLDFWQNFCVFLTHSHIALLSQNTYQQVIFSKNTRSKTNGNLVSF